MVKGPYALDHKAHMGYAYNEHVDEATTRPIVEVQILLSCQQVKRRFFGQAFIDWQNRGDHSDDGRVTYAIFRKISTRRLQG